MEVREQRGLKIAKMDNQIKRIDASTYIVKSQSNHGEYCVSKDRFGWKCECPDHVFRHVKCKHIFAVEFSVSLRAEVAVRRIEPIENLTECMFCGSSNIVKDGVRHNKYGDIQIFYCKECGKYFTFNIGFERMKSLRLLGVEVSHQTVYNWIKKYVKLMKKYVAKLTLMLAIHGELMSYTLRLRAI